jgi:hypothetical protein
MLTKWPSLFSNKRIKGMLSRSNTATPAPVPQENQGGFKQVVVPLSPTPHVNSEPWEPVSNSPSKNAHVEADVGP